MPNASQGQGRTGSHVGIDVAQGSGQRRQRAICTHLGQGPDRPPASIGTSSPVDNTANGSTALAPNRAAARAALSRRFPRRPRPEPPALNPVSGLPHQTSAPPGTERTNSRLRKSGPCTRWVRQRQSEAPKPGATTVCPLPLQQSRCPLTFQMLARMPGPRPLPSSPSRANSLRASGLVCLDPSAACVAPDEPAARRVPGHCPRRGTSPPGTQISPSRPMKMVSGADSLSART